MADDLYTVSDLIADALDLHEAEVTDLLRDAPFFMRLPVVPSSNGDTHKYTKETGAPVVGFRAENTGRDFDHSVDTLVSIALTILDFSWAVDKAVADRWRRGGASALIAREGRRHLRSAFFTAEEQYINGTVGGTADGFAGFADVGTLDDSDDSQVVNAGGSSDCSSVYLVRMGEDDVAGVMIEDNPIELGDTIVQNMTDGSGKNFPGYYTPGCSWVGIQVGAQRSIARIANIDNGANTLDDDLIYQAIELFPSGRQPNAIVMNRRSLRQLRNSRTATNATGAPAPLPTEVEGIPIIKTDAIGNAETALTAA